MGVEVSHTGDAGFYDTYSEERGAGHEGSLWEVGGCALSAPDGTNRLTQVALISLLTSTATPQFTHHGCSCMRSRQWLHSIGGSESNSMRLEWRARCGI
jgi:hypothetical protein